MTAVAGMWFMLFLVSFASSLFLLTTPPPIPPPQHPTRSEPFLLLLFYLHLLLWLVLLSMFMHWYCRVLWLKSNYLLASHTVQTWTTSSSCLLLCHVQSTKMQNFTVTVWFTNFACTNVACCFWYVTLFYTKTEAQELTKQALMIESKAIIETIYILSATL